jgi:MFS family permease
VTVEESKRGLPAEPATYRSLFSERQFTALFIAQAISLTGDPAGPRRDRHLVFSETGSAFLTALVYAVTYLPWLVGGPLLGGLADRLPRRAVMVCCQLTSAVLVALMAVPGMPLIALAALLFVVILAESPFLSARASLLVDVLPDDRYVLASAMNQLTIQAAQVVGFAAGGG